MLGARILSTLVSLFGSSGPGCIAQFWDISRDDHGRICKTRKADERSEFLQNRAGGGTKRRLFHDGLFESIISLENLLIAWTEFRGGKRSRRDIQVFEYTLEDGIFQLHHDLVNGRYRHGAYQQFRVSDPKARLISKAPVRDRFLHHAIHRVLYPLFDKTFIFDSYSCRNEKGTHKAFVRLVQCTRKISRNYTQPCWALKCDIRKFFNSVDHQVLTSLLAERTNDPKLLALLSHIVDSFHFRSGKGMPLGNLTSQLFANIYLDPLDKFVKHRLKVKHYLRYADDFVFLADNPDELMGYFIEVVRFLRSELKLEVHPNKTILRKLKWGIDYVGYVVLPHYCLPRKKTVQRIVRKVGRLLKNKDYDSLAKAMPSYLGYFQHSNAHGLTERLKKLSHS